MRSIRLDKVAGLLASAVLIAAAGACSGPGVSERDSFPRSSPRVTTIGDSVMLAAETQLREEIGNVDVHAVVGREVSEGLEEIRQIEADDALGEVVVIHLGNNGSFTGDQFDELMNVLRERSAIFVNLRVSAAWEAPNNAMLAENVEDYPNALLVDWHGESSSHPEYVWEDGVHLRPEGATAYAELIARRLRAPKSPVAIDAQP